MSDNNVTTICPNNHIARLVNTDECLRIESSSATGNPYLSFYQTTTRRSFIQHSDSADDLIIASEFGQLSLKTGTGGTEQTRVMINSAGRTFIGGGNLVSLTVGSDDTLSTITTTDATDKAGRIAVPHYINAEEPFGICIAGSYNGSNLLTIGGGSSIMNSATRINFNTGDTSTTTTGTTRGYFTNSQFALNVPFNSTIATGTPPISATSTTLCPNVNADLLDGQHGSAFATAGHNHIFTESANLSGSYNNISVPQSVVDLGHVFINATGAVTITGINSSSASDGERVFFTNRSSTNTITFSHESASSTAANRIRCPGSTNLVLGGYGGCILVYHSTDSRWYVVSHTN